MGEDPLLDVLPLTSGLDEDVVTKVPREGIGHRAGDTHTPHAQPNGL